MPLTLYMDVHVPSAITQGLRRRNVDVLTSQEDGTTEADDEFLLARATDIGRVFFSRDEDLLIIGRRWQDEGQQFWGVVYAHQLGPGIGQIIEDLELLAKCSDPQELRNQVIHLPLR